jgi:hypothetical protein
MKKKKKEGYISFYIYLSEKQNYPNNNGESERKQWHIFSSNYFSVIK